ncbi:MAG: hypothetical protein R3F59_24935 [Myxococcota bacterium]
MGNPVWVALWVAVGGLVGCAYVSRDEALEAWDSDGDGWPNDEDCAPDDPMVYPYAYDVRGDGCDTDCGTEDDEDGDDWPDAADCDPADPQKFPCSPYEVDGDGVDYDCDGKDGVRTDTCPGLDPDYPDVGPGDARYPSCDTVPEGA